MGMYGTLRVLLAPALARLVRMEEEEGGRRVKSEEWRPGAEMRRMEERVQRSEEWEEAVGGGGGLGGGAEDGWCVGRVRGGEEGERGQSVGEMGGARQCLFL